MASFPYSAPMTGQDRHPGSPILIRVATAADAPAIAAAHVASWQDSYSRLMPEAVLNALSVDDRTARWTRILDQSAEPRGPFVIVAERDRDVVGFASGGEQRDESLRGQGFTGEITALYVLRRAQGRCAGAGLMAAVAADLAARGHRQASLWVLRDNAPARGFYERLGGEAVGEMEDRRHGVPLVELAYGWRDLSRLGTTGRPA